MGGPSQGRQGSPREANKRKNPGESGVVMFPGGSGGAVEYTPEVFHSPRETRRKSSNVAFGGLLGGPLTAQQSELITLWDQLTVDEQQSVLGLARLLVSKKHECD